jgi:hypothetical protein
MPKRTTKKRSKRGAGIADWAKRGHQYMRSNNLYSRGLSMAYTKYGKPIVKSRAGKHAGFVNRGVQIALNKMKQSGYGCGAGLRRTGNGLRLSGGSNRLKY